MNLIEQIKAEAVKFPQHVDDQREWVRLEQVLEIVREDQAKLQPLMTHLQTRPLPLSRDENPYAKCAEYRHHLEELDKLKEGVEK